MVVEGEGRENINASCASQPGRFRSLFDQVTGAIANMASPGHKVLCGALTRSTGLEAKALFQEEGCCSLFGCVLTQPRWFFVLFLICFLWLSFGEIRLPSLLAPLFCSRRSFCFVLFCQGGKKSPVREQNGAATQA